MAIVLESRRVVSGGGRCLRVGGFPGVGLEGALWGVRAGVPVGGLVVTGDTADVSSITVGFAGCKDWRVLESGCLVFDVWVPRRIFGQRRTGNGVARHSGKREKF